MNIISPKQKKFLAMKRRGLFDSGKDANVVKPPKGSPAAANPFIPSRKNLFKI
jgi:hypothetical protein